MQELVILSRLEQERLVRAIEAGAQVRVLRQMFIWCQGGLRGVLPHGIMVCLKFDREEQVTHVECLNSLVRDPVELERLCNPLDGLSLQLAQYCRQVGRLSLHIDASVADAGHAGQHQNIELQGLGLAQLRREMRRQRLSNVLVHGSDCLPGGSTFFALFELDGPPTERHDYFLFLMLPYLHMAFLRVLANRAGSSAAAGPTLALSARELEVLSYAVKGKTNFEIGMILELSALTVKNHLQKIYRKLNVHNRVQALARSNELKLLAPSADIKQAAEPKGLRMAAQD
ncbi:LuxR C-terminal-related transcriptional regulator [Paucibacter sp. TC2R-5]|uniref:LuxR C-terminal-related transcriptional regulator n=1 Tax=Paucibacter sp. TC2R-5 TaxID=2893555 RepID=UPI0021E4A734|nr:LuxR C-terminal-related transcriptional regulator [Paucibacter sp. TC2R-5]MCV2359149.1 LuxR C-terminal-related transcriptional regulator [Paucibacter sp. TC2R-5]